MLNSDDAVDTLAAVRRANLRRALQLVFRGGGAQTRAGIARATGLTAATASSLVAELIADRLIVDGEQAASTGGKRATTLSIDASHHLILVVVMRPSGANLALLALDGTEVYRRSMRYEVDDRQAVLDAALLTIAAEYGDRLLVTGVQLPGTTDGRTVLESVQFGWQGVPLAELFEKTLGSPVLLVNDVDAEAIAEATMDADASGYRLFLHIGIGIGAAVTLDGELASGRRHRAGEIGHVQVEFGDDARLCSCGRRGCLESASSLPAMLGDDVDDAMSREGLAARAAEVDDQRLTAAARALARTIKLVSALLDPDEIVLGGPVVALGDEFLQQVRDDIAYTPTGTSAVPLRYARVPRVDGIGVAQVALSAELGVLWSPDLLDPSLER